MTLGSTRCWNGNAHKMYTLIFSFANRQSLATGGKDRCSSIQITTGGRGEDMHAFERVRRLFGSRGQVQILRQAQGFFESRDTLAAIPLLIRLYLLLCSRCRRFVQPYIINLTIIYIQSNGIYALQKPSGPQQRLTLGFLNRVVSSDSASNDNEKSLKIKGDVGMACQKVHKQGKRKVMV